MTEPVEGHEVKLDISCTASPTELSGQGPTKSNQLWSELTIHSQTYNVGGPWHVIVKRHRSGGTDTLDYYTSNAAAPQGAGPGTCVDALIARTVADFHDLDWTTPAGDLFTAWIGEDEI